jgi:S-adenosylmethionine:tRNA ribosyltransferase-isomerase
LTDAQTSVTPDDSISSGDRLNPDSHIPASEVGSANSTALIGARLSDFDYTLPPERIAQTPLADRASSRLLVLDRSKAGFEHRHFRDLTTYLRPGDVLVLNDTRVTAMRLFIERAGKQIELFLISRLAAPDEGNAQLWHALVRPGKKMLPGVHVDIGGGLAVDVVSTADDRGGRVVRITAEAGVDIDAVLAELSIAPLPPYIATQLKGEERERYQTVYARHGGSAAAPTAGLHFTPELLQTVEAMGVRVARVTLHVGLGTFRPIETDVISEHIMHAERYSISTESADIVNSATGRIIAVGTTSARTLEASAVGPRQVAASDGETSLYITPGYQFKIVDALVTNFHMPRSTLLVLVSAMAGRERIQEAYHAAMDNEYRFLSFGDAMLIL